MAVDKKNLLFLPFEVASTPIPGESHCVSKAWWAVHPKKGLILYRRTPKSRYCTPQFNINKLVTDKLIQSLYPFAEAQQIEYVFLRYDSENGFYIPKEAVPA